LAAGLKSMKNPVISAEALSTAPTAGLTPFGSNVYGSDEGRLEDPPIDEDGAEFLKINKYIVICGGATS